MKKTILAGIALTVLSLGANAAPISFVPQGDSVGFIDIDPDAWFAIFDYDESPACGDGLPLPALDCKTGAPLIIGNPTSPISADVINITPTSGSDYSATKFGGAGASIDLLNSSRFLLTASFDGLTWWNPYSVDFLGTSPTTGADLYKVNFIGIDVPGRELDASFSLTINAIPSVVPVPAAVWLFGSGLLGLAAVARRKANV